MELRLYQSDLVNGLARKVKEGKRRVVAQLPTGGGKCFARDTPIRMYDGTIKMVQDVSENDILIGPDAQPRIVSNLARGEEMMYKIIGSDDSSYTVNESHILSLIVVDPTGITMPSGEHYKCRDILNISVREYLYLESQLRDKASGWKTFIRGRKHKYVKFIFSVRIEKIVPLTIDNYYGFEVDKDHLFLLGDFTVAHNSICFASLINRVANNRPGRIVVAVHREELLNQAVKTLKKAFDINAGIVTAGVKYICRLGESSYRIPFPNARVVVGMVETVNNRLKANPDFFGETSMLVIDEVHLANFNKIYEAFEFSLIVGFTATPLAANKKEPLKDYFDDIVVGVDIQQLINEGHLLPNITRSIIGGVDRSNIAKRGNDFDNKIMSSMYSASKYVNHAVLAYQTHIEYKKTMVFNCSVAHSQLVTEAFCRAGYNARHFDATMKDERSEILKWFHDTDDAILCSIGTFTVGFDEPTVEAIIVNKSTLSKPLWLQMCLDLETEVLTSNGWKRHYEVNNGDLVASFNMSDNSISYDPCSDKVFRPLHESESMYSLTSPYMNFNVTNKHNLLVRPRSRGSFKKYQLVEAENVSEIKSHYEIPIAGYINNPDIPLEDHEIAFIAWFLSDGSKDKVTQRITINQSAAQPQYLHDSIIDCIEKCGFKYKISRVKRKGDLSKYEDMVLYRVSYGNPRGTDKHLTGCSRLDLYLDKTLCDDLMKMSRRQLGVFLKYFNQGDGRKNVKANYIPRSLDITGGDNKILTERLQILCITNGYKCNVSTHHYNKNPIFNLHIKDRDYACIKGSSEYKHGNILLENDQRPDYVWCVSTKNGTLITRYNGKVTIMGNCGRGGRTFEKMAHFDILDMGGNALTHGDWNTPVDWEDIFWNPVKPKGGGVPPVKSCPSCDAILHMSVKICPYCGAIAAKEVEYDKGDLNFDIVTKGIDVKKLIKKNEQYKPYRSLHIIKTTVVKKFRENFTGNHLSPEIRELLNRRFQVEVEKWATEQKERGVEGIEYSDWVKRRTRDWLFEELDKYFGKSLVI